jgi:hypothetical protein
VGLTASLGTKASHAVRRLKHKIVKVQRSDYALGDAARRKRRSLMRPIISIGPSAAHRYNRRQVHAQIRRVAEIEYAATDRLVSGRGVDVAVNAGLHDGDDVTWSAD